jgi:hypothetical protein
MYQRDWDDRALEPVEEHCIRAGTRRNSPLSLTRGSLRAFGMVDRAGGTPETTPDRLWRGISRSMSVR